MAVTRPRSVEEQIVSCSFTYTPPASMPVGTIDVIVGPSGMISASPATGTSTGDPALGRLRVGYNVNVWATNLPLNNSGLSISNQMCVAAGQLNFRLSTTTIGPASPQALTIFVQQF